MEPKELGRLAAEPIVAALGRVEAGAAGSAVRGEVMWDWLWKSTPSLYAFQVVAVGIANAHSSFPSMS